MLACARIGAIHSVVFAGFSAEALRARVVDSQVNRSPSPSPCPSPGPSPSPSPIPNLSPSPSPKP